MTEKTQLNTLSIPAFPVSNAQVSPLIRILSTSGNTPNTPDRRPQKKSRQTLIRRLSRIHTVVMKLMLAPGLAVEMISHFEAFRQFQGRRQLRQTFNRNLGNGMRQPETDLEPACCDIDA